MSISGDQKHRESRRSWFRFSLRSFLIAAMLFGMVLAWFGKVQYRVQRQRRVVSQLQSRGAGVGYDYQIAGDWDPDKWSPPGLKVLRLLLGDDAFAEVHTVYLLAPRGVYRSTPDDLASLAKFPRLKVLSVGGKSFGDESLAEIVRHRDLSRVGFENTRVTALGLRELRSLERLSALELCGPGFDDDALHALGELRHLEHLQLHFTSVTAGGWSNLADLHRLKRLDIYPGNVIGDKELAHISHLSQLEALRLFQGAVSDDGVRLLAGLTHLRELQLNRTQISDEGLEMISRLPRLKRLELDHTTITDAGIAHLEKAAGLKRLRVDGTLVTDEGIARLKSLRGLKELWVGPHVTKAGAERLLQELPECNIRGWDTAGFECFSLQTNP